MHWPLVIGYTHHIPPSWRNHQKKNDRCSQPTTESLCANDPPLRSLFFGSAWPSFEGLVDLTGSAFEPSALTEAVRIGMRGCVVLGTKHEGSDRLDISTRNSLEFRTLQKQMDVSPNNHFLCKGSRLQISSPSMAVVFADRWSQPLEDSLKIGLPTHLAGLLALSTW